MMIIHVECSPDEILIKGGGFTKKQIKHHQGKSRVFAALRKSKDQIAMVDEDPGSTAHPYEKELILKSESHDIKYFIDQKRNHKILVLKGNLEVWIIATCKKSTINMEEFGLPQRADELHEVINNRLSAFGKLVDSLNKNSESFDKLTEWLKVNPQ